MKKSCGEISANQAGVHATAALKCGLIGVAVAASISWFMAPPVLLAQTAERVMSDAQEPCPDCSLVLGPPTVIGDGDDNYIDAPVIEAAVNGLGHVYVLTLSMSTIVEYDRDGAFVRRIGRTGDGPGEWRRALGLLVAPGDSLFIFHTGGTSVFTREGEFVRQYPGHRALQSPIKLASGHIVNLANPGPPVGRSILHVYPEDGGEPRSFGPVTVPGPRQGVVSMPPHVLAPSNGDSFWLAPRAPYRLERWNSQGEMNFLLERRASHHVADDAPITYENGRLVATYPLLSAVAEDSDGRLWTAVVERTEGRAGTERSFESVIEVLDPGSGTLLGTARVPGAVSLITQDGYIVSHSEGELGVQLLTIVQAHVRVSGR